MRSTSQQYFYHPDHLGSSNFISDASGEACQFLAYLPYGEQWVDQRSSGSYDAPYKFSGKELDAETGYNYFGARYYDSGLSVWLSVDPLGERHPSMSCYSVMGNNPLSYTDPDGRDIVYFNHMGQEVHRVISTTEYRTYIQSTAAINHPTKSSAGWKEVPMPRIIQVRSQTGESVSGTAYQEHDYLIAARTGLFNQTKNNGKLIIYSEGGDLIPQEAIRLIPDLDPTRIKAMAIQESHNGTTGEQDILSANNGGDFDEYKAAYGLIEGQSLDENGSLYYGIRFLATKGFRGGVTYDQKSGASTYAFQGWDSASKHYNGQGVRDYQAHINKMIDNSKSPTSKDY